MSLTSSRATTDGFNVSDLSQPLHCDDLSTLSEFERDYCETNLPLRGQFKHAWLPSWSPGKMLDADSMQRNGMDGSIVRPLPACLGTHPCMLSCRCRLITSLQPRLPCRLGQKRDS